MSDTEFKRDFKRRVKWRLFGTGPEMVRAFEKDQVDLGYMGLPPAIVGISKGVPLKCVAGGHVEGTVLVASKHYQALEQLNYDLKALFTQFIGKVIGVPSKGSIHDVILNHYLKEFNLLEKIRVKNYAQAEFIALDMKMGTLDGGVGTPALAVFCETVMDSQLIIPSESLWPFNPSYGIFCNSTLIESQPDLIIQFLTHHKKACELLRNSPQIAGRVIAENLHLIDPFHAEEIIKISPKYCIALPKTYIDSTMEFVKKMFALGYIKYELKESEIFDLTFINLVHPEKDHY
jgi:NitT/TauT family transport system substrate-binding protein